MTEQELLARMEVERKKDTTPKAAVCFRGKDKYDAEVIFGGKNFLLKRGFVRHEDAQAYADGFCMELSQQFRDLFFKFDLKVAQE